jgi:predicted site-specific integrase-resolvase
VLAAAAQAREEEAGEGRLLGAAEVAALFRVHPKTVSRWGSEGKLQDPVRTAGGHRRYRESGVLTLLGGASPEPESGS